MKKPPTSVAGAIFSPSRDQILLIKRRDVPVWVLPGGGIEPNESPESAIIREIAEETGFVATIDRLVGDYTPINSLAKPTQLFECIPTHQIPLPHNPECKEVRFFPLDALPKEIPPPYRQWIGDARTRSAPIHKQLSEITYLKFFWYLVSHPILVARFLLARIGYPINS